MKLRRTFASLVLFAGGALLAGCHTTTIRNGNVPAARPTVEYDEKWHHGLVFGIAEVSGPYDLQKICPNGWAEIETQTSFLNGLVDAITWGLYSPQTVTVKCAAGAPMRPMAPAYPMAPTYPMAPR